MKHLLVVFLLMGAVWCGAGEIEALTETPLAEFALPDGSVLTNAYVWRRSSQGLMILHDGGNYFLNFKLLPDDWKAVYLGSPEGEPLAVEQPAEVEEAKVEPARDRYKAANTLAKIPDLDAAAQRLLLGADLDGDLDQQILMLGALHNFLVDNRTEAKRFLLFIEEREYELDEVDRERLFQPCTKCGGDGRVTKTCTSCDGTGKCPRCGGVGTRKSSFDDSRSHCTTCRGTGKCFKCKGAGEFSFACSACKGAGKVPNRDYCEILRDRIVREVNATATSNRWAVVTSSGSLQGGKVLSKIPGLNKSALAYYLSEEYGGGMDTNLVVVCLMHSLLKKDFPEAKRFHLMLGVLFPDDEVLEIEKYLKPCEECGSTGRMERDCRSCDGSGKCNRCAGTGMRTLDISGRKVHCTTCRGSGRCPSCKGKGVLQFKCQACDGRGSVLDRQRVEIKLGLLVDRLNEFPDRQ